MIFLFEDVFERENFSIPKDEHLKKVLGKADFDVFVALLNDKVVGGITTYIIDQYYSEKPLAYIYDLAVDIRLQRQGIGKQLILFVNKYYTEKGFEEVYVQAEKEDKHAVSFYRNTKPSGEEEVNYFYYLLS